MHYLYLEQSLCPKHYVQLAVQASLTLPYALENQPQQVHQAICYDYTISLLRRKMRDPKRVSMGTLYWQLNDVWQVRVHAALPSNCDWISWPYKPCAA